MINQIIRMSFIVIRRAALYKYIPKNYPKVVTEYRNSLSFPNGCQLEYIIIHEWKYLAIAVTEITMSADQSVRLLTNIIIP